MLANARLWLRVRAHAALMLAAVVLLDVTTHRHRDR